MNNIQKLRELTKSLDFQSMVTKDTNGRSKVPTKDPDVFATVVGVIKSHKDARVAIVDFPAGSEIEQHYHEEKEIFIILSGEMELTTDGRTINLKKGDSYYVTEHANHSAVWPIETRVIAVTIPDSEI